ncbi:MAG TPA: gliding motility-associated C-terminal domain-containing protein [Ferruginibacter sp.]|nr:gliding motility-associated C-terminal domain-containing protein [Ferruginibacter sp.]HMP19881.1 gliding motility-associated C-terminal domain-containing protein [Ferruginibacter sp.]
MIIRLKIIVLVAFCFVMAPAIAVSQCNQPVSSFPYFEDFEASDGGWFAGGTVSDWAWGSPTKDVISAAGSGANCWITGGLTGNYYNNGQASWLQSPCFDFTNLQSPYIRFKVFWETEQGFDGANLQYSVNNGNSWVNVGTAGSSSTCYNGNWYNTGTVSYLSAFTGIRGGWSGSVGSASGNCRTGNGSGGWVTADQLLKDLGGQPRVIFRFNFGAGTLCNNYNGFAVDDFTISEIPSPSGTIGFGCTGNNTFSFEFVTSLCPETYSWDFGDPASGNDNLSNLAKPVHIFSAPGSYQVQVTVTSQGSQPFVATQTISVLALNTVILSPSGCNDEPDGAAEARVTGNSSPVNYRWDSNPIQYTATATGLSAGTYRVTVSASNTCPVAADIVINNTAIALSPVVEQPGCRYTTGAIKLQQAAGTAPYQYSWLPPVSTSPVATNLANGTYRVTVSNEFNCVKELSFNITTLTTPVVVIRGLQNEDCGGQYKGEATVDITGGTAPFEYSWNTIPVQTTATAYDLKAGAYTVTVTDSNGCIASIPVNIAAEGICNDVYFAGAFTPGKATNATFGALGNLVSIRLFNLSIYNRYGQLVYSSNNPFEKWEGTLKGKRAAAGTYVWHCQFQNINGIRYNRKGTVVLMR